MASGNTSDILVTAAMFCMSFTDIVVVTSMSEVLPEDIPRSFKIRACTNKTSKVTRTAVQYKSISVFVS